MVLVSGIAKQINTQMMKIRKGTSSDLSALRALIVELAIYELEPDAVEVTLKELEADGFGPNAIFHFFVGEIDGVVEGIALYYFKYSTWKGRCLFLEDIVVRENQRGKGLGKLLFDAVVSVAAKEQCKRMEWQVLKWNEPAIQFYQNKYGADLNGEWFNGKLVYDQIQSLAN